MEPFTHLLLTRFNVYMGEALGPSAKRLDSSWLEIRLREFETFCLPSVRAQRDAEFKWLVFCDEDSPSWFKDRILSYGEVLTPVFSKGITRAETGRTLDNLGYTNREFLITTRLDNDDAITENFLSRVQGHFREQELAFVDFPRGVRSYRGGTYTAHWRSNPFISMIERRSGAEPFTTVFAFAHDRIRAEHAVITDWTRNAWLRSMHSANTVVTAVGLPRVSVEVRGLNVDWAQLPSQESLARRGLYSIEGYMRRLSSKRRVQRVLSRLGIGTAD